MLWSQQAGLNYSKMFIYTIAKSTGACMRIRSTCAAFCRILAICQINIEWSGAIQKAEILDFTCDTRQGANIVSVPYGFLEEIPPRQHLQTSPRFLFPLFLYTL